jgi:hypothetical protein
MTQLNGNLYEIANVTANTFELSGINSTAYGTYTSGGTASPSHVPKLSTTSGSSTVSVTLQDHGVSQNDKVVLPLSTTVGGVAISGTYVVTSVSGTDAFTITAANTASSTATAMMNGGESEYVYTISLGPAGTGTGYGIGGYGSGGYGTGTTSSAQTGTDIAATDWTLDNWGDTLIASPKGGSLFYWAPNGGFSNMTMVGTGPTYNTGSFVASPARILVAYGSSIQHAIGTTQDPLVIRTSDIDDFSIWTTSTTNQARTFRIPNGSRIVRGMRAGFAAWRDVVAKLSLANLAETGGKIEQQPVKEIDAGKVGGNTAPFLVDGVALAGGIRIAADYGEGSRPRGRLAPGQVGIEIAPQADVVCGIRGAESVLSGDALPFGEAGADEIHGYLPPILLPGAGSRLGEIPERPV